MVPVERAVLVACMVTALALAGCTQGPQSRDPVTLPKPDPDTLGPQVQQPLLPEGPSLPGAPAKPVAATAPEPCEMAGRAAVAHARLEPLGLHPVDAWSDDTGELRTTQDSQRQAGHAELDTPFLTGDAVMARAWSTAAACAGEARVSAAHLATTSQVPVGASAVQVVGGEAWSRSACGMSQGGLRLDRIVVLGLPPLALPDPIPPNFRIDHPVLTIVLNEQVRVPGSLQVTGVHVLGPGTDLRLLVASSASTGCPVPPEATGCVMTGRAAMARIASTMAMPLRQGKGVVHDSFVWLQSTADVETRERELHRSDLQAFDDGLHQGAGFAGLVATQPDLCGSYATARVQDLRIDVGKLAMELPPQVANEVEVRTIEVRAASAFSSVGCGSHAAGVKIGYLAVDGRAVIVDGRLAESDGTRNLPPNSHLDLGALRLTFNDQSLHWNEEGSEGVAYTSVLRIAVIPSEDTKVIDRGSDPPLDVRFVTARSDIHACGGLGLPFPGGGAGIPLIQPCIPIENPDNKTFEDELFCPPPPPGVPLPIPTLPPIPPVEPDCLPVANPLPGVLPGAWFCPPEAPPGPDPPPPPAPPAPPPPPPVPPPPPPPPPPVED